MALRLTNLALAHPRLVLLVLACVTAVSALGLGQMRSANFLEGNLSPDDPRLAEFQRLTDEFENVQLALFAIGCGERPPCRDVFEPRVLETVRQLTGIARRYTGVEEVWSLATVSMLSGGEALHVERLGDRLDSESVSHFRNAIEADPTLNGTIVSPDGRTTVIVVRFGGAMPDDVRSRAALEMLGELRAAAEQAGADLHAGGHAIRVAVVDEYVRHDLAVLGPAMVVILVLLLWWVFRNATSVALALGAVALPTLWAFGLMCWTGRPFTPLVSTMPILILAVGMTDAVHLLVRVHDLRRAPGPLDPVVREVVREVGRPTTVTAVTSSLGFLSFLAGQIPNLRDFGIFSAAGILGAWLTTFTLIPALLVLFSPRVQSRTPSSFVIGDQLLESIRRVATRRDAAVILVSVVALVVSLVGVRRIVPDNDVMRLVGEGDSLVQAEEFLRGRLRPLETVEVLYEAPDGRSVLEGESLERLERAETLLQEFTGSDSIVSILPILRTAHRELVDGRSVVPREAGAASQLLLLAEAVGAGDLRRVVTADARVARLSAGYEWASGKTILSDLEDLRKRLESVLGDPRRWTLTGSVLMNAHVGEVILQSQLASFSTAFVTIFLVLLLFIRSLPLAALGMVPNVLPVAIILGFMGFVGIYLDVGTAMIASILLGVSVDDTVYFLLHYQRARRGGASVSDAVAFTFAIAGKPAIFCAASLALGFFAIAFSSFQSLAIFGLLSAVAVLLAAVTELFVMPALLERIVARRGGG